MRTCALLFLVLAPVLRAADVPPPLHPAGEPAAITERELEELAPQATFDEIRPLLGGYALKSLGRPAVTFRLQTNAQDEFIVFWNEETGRLQLIAKYPLPRATGEGGFFVWPASLRGKRMDAPLDR